MFELTKAAFKKTMEDFKKVVYITGVATQAVYLIYLCYALIWGNANPIVSGILAAISLAYLVFYLIVTKFGKAPDGAVLVSQVQAGGTGLNIQSASVIIFCEPQIKPSIENQAIARAYRMGQVRDVLVYRLLADDTIDESMLELLKTKQLQFDSFADESVVGEESLKPGEAAWISKLVEEEKKRLTQAQ